MCWKKEAAARNWQHQKHNACRSDYSDAKSAPIWAFQPLLSWQHVQQGRSWQRWCWTQLEATRHLKATVPSIFLGLKFNGMNSKLPVQSALCQSHSKQWEATPRALFPPLPQAAPVQDSWGTVVCNQAVLDGLQGPEQWAGGKGNSQKSRPWGSSTTLRTRLLANTEHAPGLARGEEFQISESVPDLHPSLYTQPNNTPTALTHTCRRNKAIRSAKIRSDNSNLRVHIISMPEFSTLKLLKIRSCILTIR